MATASNATNVPSVPAHEIRHFYSATISVMSGRCWKLNRAK